MSERGSFTSQYIYDKEDWCVIENALDHKSKYLCISPPATWSNGQTEFEMPIVSGKVGALSSDMEWMTLMEALDGVETKEEVKFVVVSDSGDHIEMIVKDPDGQTSVHSLHEVVYCDECVHYEEDPKNLSIGTCKRTKKETKAVGFCDNGICEPIEVIHLRGEGIW